LLKASAHPEPQTGGIRSSSAGATQADFKKRGEIWLPGLLRGVQKIIEPMLSNMHKGTVHVGKGATPGVGTKRPSTTAPPTCKEKLDEAIRSERYEDAARFRDEIHQSSRRSGTMP